MKILNIECSKKLDQKVNLAGWVHARRDHGQIIFIDLRDSSGLVQLVFSPEKTTVYKIGDSLRPEWVIAIEGKVKKRPKGMENPKIETGEVEVEVETIEILNKSKTLPFEVSKDTKNMDEEIRLKYRYLDLRSERMLKNLKARDKIITFIREYLHQKGFLEIETPILTKGTPEGAREYIVPSRQQPGKFYVLPQSPQQFKQLLMVAGVEKYFQIPRCFRDEDPRGDRQPEFTQLDLEMSFVKEEDVWRIWEDCLIKMVKKLYPKKKITKIPFPRLKYQECLKKYKTDKPDLRKNPAPEQVRFGAGKKDPDELAFVWLVDCPLFEYGKEEKKIVSWHHLFTAPKEEDLKLLDKEPLKVKAKAYDIVLNGVEIGGGSIRIHQRNLQEKIFKILGLKKDEIEKRFGHMLRAFEYGTPPHGGIAPGIDRIVAVLENEPSIREVIAFPKTGDGRDLMMGAPSGVPKKQLDELKIEVKRIK